MQKGSKKPASSQQNLKTPIHLLVLTKSILCSFGASSPIPQPSTSTPGAFWGARSARPGCRALPVARPLCGSRDPTYWGASPTAPRPPRSGQGEWGWKMVPEQKDLVKWGSGVWRVRNFRRIWTQKTTILDGDGKGMLPPEQVGVSWTWAPIRREFWYTIWWTNIAMENGYL